RDLFPVWCQPTEYVRPARIWNRRHHDRVPRSDRLPEPPSSLPQNLTIRELEILALNAGTEGYLSAATRRDKEVLVTGPTPAEKNAGCAASATQVLSGSGMD